MLLGLGVPAAFAQACPPNSHAVIVFLPNSSRTAHCWCDVGYRNSGGACTLIPGATPGPPVTGGKYWPQYGADQLKGAPVR